ncbi:MAG: hypothetical protein OEV92_08650 [Nitrospinota bacterium]|nr:hypothetical protein [Nitrospinota bacterium]
MKRFLLASMFSVVILGAAATSFAADTLYKGWTPTIKGPMPSCGVNVIALGGDDILQATVDIYCGVKPGNYQGYINPKAMATYKVKGSKYPDGDIGVLEFKKIDVFFLTSFKDGQPTYDVRKISTGESIASQEAGHPLNPATCAKCHASFKGVCKGFVCGNRM